MIDGYKASYAFGLLRRWVVAQHCLTIQLKFTLFTDDVSCMYHDFMYHSYKNISYRFHFGGNEIQTT